MLPSSSAKDAANRHSYTEVRTERICHDWTIKRFHLLPEDAGEKICSPWFYSRDKSEKWNLAFYPRGSLKDSAEDIDYIDLGLKRDSSGKSPMTVDVELKILKSDIILRNSSFTYKPKPRDNRGCRKFLKRSKLFPTNSADDDEFTISCIINIPSEVITSSFDVVDFDSERSQSNDNFRSLFENPILSDFTIIIGDKKFAVHKAILANRSSVFAAMFEHKDMKENHKKEMEIGNIEPDVIKGMLEFMYSNQVTNMKELASELLGVADKYDLEELKTRCEKTLYEELSEKNAADVLLLADLHRADILKECVIRYIVDHASEVMKSNNWKKIGRNPELMVELFKQSVLPQETMKKLKARRHKSK